MYANQKKKGTEERNFKNIDFPKKVNQKIHFGLKYYLSEPVRQRKLRNTLDDKSQKIIQTVLDLETIMEMGYQLQHGYKFPMVITTLNELKIIAERQKQRNGGSYPSKLSSAIGLGLFDEAKLALRTPGIDQTMSDEGPGRDRDGNPTIYSDEYDTANAAIDVYKSTSKSKAAILHSFGDPNAEQNINASKRYLNIPMDATSHERETDDNTREDRRGKYGEIYNPNRSGKGQGHDMFSNSAWLLGVMHNKRPIILSCALTAPLLVRSAYRDGNLAQGIQNRMSALGREIVALLEYGGYSYHRTIRLKNPNVQGEDIIQTILTTKQDNSKLTLRDIQTEYGKTAAQFNSLLKSKGLPTINVDG